MEFNSPLWLLSMDLRKAFDTINHKELCRALGYHDLSPEYIEFLKILYKDQAGIVNGSRHFSISTGVKQVDGLSAILFNTALDIAF